MKLKYLFPLACFCIGGMAGCTDDDTPTEPTETSAVNFQLSTRADIDDETQLTRLYLGERKPEHASEDLHCNRVVDITGGQVALTDLKPQWYKFVFLCVPDIAGTGTALFTEETPGTGSCDLNQQMIDYLPVLQQPAGTEMPKQDTPDGDIFRKVINRWVKSGDTVTEDVVLNRLNGQLIIDMGVLEDQFDGRVTQITLQVDNTPTRLYLTDNDVDEIKTADPQTVTWTTKPQANNIEEGGKPIDPAGHHVITVNLLPGTLNGSLTVQNDRGYTYTYPLKGSASGSQLSIKPNIRTKLEFNGIMDGNFTVKYAGYTDTGIDVDDNDWDGWEENNQ